MSRILLESMGYLMHKGWTPTNKGWINPHTGDEYARWTMKDALEIQKAKDEAERERQLNEVRDEWKAV